MISRLSRRFKQDSKQDSKANDLVAEIAATDEATLVEQLRALASRLDDADARATLDALLEALPDARLLLIVAEAHEHGFLPAAELDALLARLPLGRVARLFASAGPRDRAGVLRRPALQARAAEALAALGAGHALETAPDAAALVDLVTLAFGAADADDAAARRLADLVRRCIERGEVLLLGTILRAVGLPRAAAEELTDRHIAWLWRHHAATLLESTTARPAQAAAQVARLLSQIDGPERAAVKGSTERDTRAALRALLACLDDDQAWAQLRGFVSRSCACQRGWAFSFGLGLLSAPRTARIIAARHSDAEIGVYWPLFSEAVRGELCKLGRGRLQSSSASSRNRRRSARSKQRRAHAGPREARGRARSSRLSTEQREALRVMTERYGFHVGMSYQEAQRRYWRLALQWHPDRAGTGPTQQREMSVLNQAWDAAKQCFAAGLAG